MHSKVCGKGKAKARTSAKAMASTKEKGKGKCKDKAKEGTSDTSNVDCFFCQKKATPERIALNYRPGSLRRKQWVTSRVQTPFEEDAWIFALDQEHEERCEPIMIDSGASVHVCPPDHGHEYGLRKSSKTRPLLTASREENETAQNETSEL